MFSLFNKTLPQESKKIDTPEIHPEYSTMDIHFVGSRTESDKINFGYIVNNKMQYMLKKLLKIDNREINADDAILFLDALLILKQEFGLKFVIEKSEYDQLLADLVQNKYLTKELGNDYQKRMQTDITLTTLKKLVAKKKDYKQAIELAKIYNQKKGEYYFPPAESKSLNWLLNAIEYAPHGIEDVEKAINLKEFLSSFTSLDDVAFIFVETAVPLLTILKNTLKDLDFGTFFHHSSVNEYLTEFLKDNKALKSLDLSTSPTTDSWNHLKSDEMYHLANGLKYNDTLETLDLAEQPIGDSGLERLLNSLSSNSDCHLKKLNLFGTHLTEKGLERLEKFMETNKTLEWINIGCNVKSFSPEKINAYTKRNKLTKEQLENEPEIQINFKVEIEAATLPQSLEVAIEVEVTLEETTSPRLR